jgi:hypothetical protein
MRSLSQAVEYILPEQQNSFVRELEPHVLSCVKDANGNHVIQKLIERLSPGRLPFIHCFRDNLFDLATHPYGCRVLQRCFVQLPEEHSRPLLEELHKYSINLMQNQFGVSLLLVPHRHGLMNRSELCDTVYSGARSATRQGPCRFETPRTYAADVATQICLQRLRENTGHRRL